MSWLRLLICVVAGLAGTFATAAWSLTPAQQLVEKMAISARQLSYKGYFVYERGQQSHAYQIIHGVDGDVERQRLVFLDGEPFEIINDGHSLKCLHSGDPASHLFSHRQADIQALTSSDITPALIWKNYTAQLVGKVRVADRAGTRVQLNPLDQHRYPFMFVVDDETGLMLKMVVSGAQGQVLEKFHYVAVEYGPVEKQELLPHISDYKVMQHLPSAGEDDIADSQKHLWQLNWIPSGFVQEKAKMRAWHGSAPGQQVYMYADGLAAFSVFIEPAEAGTGSETSSQNGSTSAVSRYVNHNGLTFLVTVVGEIPIMTAKQIALSVEPAS